MNNNPNNSMNGFPTGNYPPYGFNDNNFNRKRVPSNMHPPHGGMSGNPFDNFTQLSTNTQMLMNNHPSMSNFNSAFNRHDPMIEPLDYGNKNDMLHNNVGGMVLDEHVVEYRINIDSLDRNIKVYPNPFCFTVKFNPPSSGIVRTEVLKNGVSTAVNDFFEGPPKPHIHKEFRNVKYIKLDSIVLPQYSNIVETSTGIEFDKDSLLIDDRYVALVIDELESNRILCTSDGSLREDPDTGKVVSPPCPFALIFPDKLLGRNYYTGTPYYGSIIYKNSLLGNISSLTIQLTDSCGVPLKFDGLFTNRELEKAEEEGNPIPTSDMRHPLNKKLQVHVSFIIGVVESQINTNTKFEK